MTIRLYLRVSTDPQDFQSQTQQLGDWLTQQPLTHTVRYEDTASGSVPWKQRLLGKAIADAAPGDTIAVSEVSRIARSTLGVLSFLQTAAELEVTVIAARNKLTLDGSLPSKITVTILALAAEIERDLLRERTRQALAARKAAGVRLGRPPGSRSLSKLDAKAEDVQRLLDAHVSKRAIARLLECAPGTLYAYLRSRP
jgi:DNA invertase Pin-like site-specific DNA recombinase